jgi:hypothetical protein
MRIDRRLRCWHVWNCTWQGHRIVYENWFSIPAFFGILSSGEKLYLDGKLIAEGEGPFRMRAKIGSEVQLEGRFVNISAEGGPTMPWGLPGAKIYVDEKPVGGDLHRRFKKRWEICAICGVALLLAISAFCVRINQKVSRLENSRYPAALDPEDESRIERALDLRSGRIDY